MLNIVCNDLRKRLRSKVKRSAYIKAQKQLFFEAKVGELDVLLSKEVNRDDCYARMRICVSLDSAVNTNTRFSTKQSLSLSLQFLYFLLWLVPSLKFRLVIL